MESIEFVPPRKSIYRIIAKKKQKTPGAGTKPRQSQTKPVSKALAAFPEKHPGGVFFNISLKISTELISLSYLFN
jgi:hypothetical protein